MTKNFSNYLNCISVALCQVALPTGKSHWLNFPLHVVVKNELFSNKIFLATKEAKFMFQMLLDLIADINPIGAVLECLLPRVNGVQDGH